MRKDRSMDEEARAATTPTRARMAYDAPVGRCMVGEKGKGRREARDKDAGQRAVVRGGRA